MAGVYLAHAQGRLGRSVGGWRRRSILLACVAALRVIAVLLSLEFSGAAHAALDGYEALTGVTQHADDDCEDEAGHECAPGCPNCHCWHAGLPTVPPAAVSDTLKVAARAEQGRGFVPYTAMPLREAALASLYRPPRLSSHS